MEKFIVGQQVVALITIAPPAMYKKEYINTGDVYTITGFGTIGLLINDRDFGYPSKYFTCAAKQLAKESFNKEFNHFLEDSL